MVQPTYWLSPVPDGCQLCGKPFDGIMFDANLPGLGWGNYCKATFDRLGGRLGVGLGQRYELGADGKWLCTGGL